MTDRTRHNPGLPDEVWARVAAPQRRAVLNGLGSLDPTQDADFDRLIQLAASAFSAPVALVSLVDIDRQWFKSRLGFEEGETPVNQSFCAHAIAAADDVTVVVDATNDARFAENPLVTGVQHVRFYAGAPIETAGERIGTICVLDHLPRPYPSATQLATLTLLAGLASSLFTLKEGTRSGVAARLALVREEKRRAVAMEAASLSSWIWDVQSGRVECDESLPILFGLPPTSVIPSKSFFRAIDRRDARAANEMFQKALATGDDYFGEYRVRGIEPTRWLAARGRVVERSADGRPLLVFGVNYDISERKGTEERQRLLLRELNHRVKNTLATVQALATQTVRHASDPREFLTAFGARLQALGAAHGLLSDREWRGISLQELARMEVLPFDDQTRSRIRIVGDDILLTPDQALGLGMVFHELASNAFRYGSLSVPAGRVDLSWRLEGKGDDRRLQIRWREGGGPPVQPPSRAGFGTILIRRSLDKVIASEVTHEFRPEGVAAAISLPMRP